MRGMRYGLNLAGGSDYFCVTGNLCKGDAQPIFVGLDSNASTNRRVHDNSGLGYSGLMKGSSFSVPASGATWSNTTPFVLDIYIGGGEVNAVSVNGGSIPGLKSGLVRVEPGGTYSIVYTTAPHVTYISEG